MYIKILFSIFLVGQINLDRTSFNMLGSPTLKQELIMPQPKNRLLEDKYLHDKITNNARDTANYYIKKPYDECKKLVKDKVMDWLENNNKLPLNESEQIQLDLILDNEIIKNIVQEHNRSLQQGNISLNNTKINTKNIINPTPTKEWFWSKYRNKSVLLYGWTDPNTGKKLYNLNEQDPAVQDILKGVDFVQDIVIKPQIPVQTQFQYYTIAPPQESFYTIPQIQSQIQSFSGFRSLSGGCPGGVCPR
jgi:hypothetical protein